MTCVLCLSFVCIAGFTGNANIVLLWFVLIVGFTSDMPFIFFCGLILLVVLRVTCALLFVKGFHWWLSGWYFVWFAFMSGFTCDMWFLRGLILLVVLRVTCVLLYVVWFLLTVIRLTCCVDSFYRQRFGWHVSCFCGLFLLLVLRATRILCCCGLFWLLVLRVTCLLFFFAVWFYWWFYGWHVLCYLW